ncbi:MAG: zinc ribbon domain-containing protein [Candidatus Thorarchaeota archaeon]
MSSPNKDKNIEKKLKDLEDKFENIDEKLLALTEQVNFIASALDEKIETEVKVPREIEPEEVPPEPVVPVVEEVVEAEPLETIICPNCKKSTKAKANFCSNCGSSIKPVEVVKDVLDREIPFVEPVVASEVQTVSTPLRREVAVETTPVVPSKTKVVIEKPRREPFKLIEFFKNEENLPYLLLFAFFILLAAIVYGTISQIINLPFFTPLNAFLILGLASCAFTILGLIWKLFLDRRIKKSPEKKEKIQNYYIFPWTFQGIGAVGIFLSFILSQTAIEGAIETKIILPIAVAASIISIIIAILFKNELLIGEATLFLVLILLVPIIIEAPLIPSTFSGYLYFAFFSIFIVGAYILAKLKITAAPSLVALISFPVYAFIPSVYKALELESLIVIIPACLVATLLLENAYDNFKLYNNKAMRTVITVVDYVLPLSSFYYLIFLRETQYAMIPSWEILISTAFLVVTYLLTTKQVFSSRFQEYDIQKPNIIEFLYVFLINLTIFLALISELLFVEIEVLSYIYLSIYLVLQIAFSIITSTWKVDRATTTFTHNILSLLFTEAMFVLFFANVADVTSISLGYEIVMSISLAFLFLGPLINIFVLRKEEYVLRSAFSVILLGGINLFVFNFLPRFIPVDLTIARSICELSIIIFSIVIGVVALLDTMEKYKFGSQTQKLTSSHVHAVSILSLTSSLWFFNQNEVINYIINISVFVSATLWCVNSYFRRKQEKSITENLLGYLAISIIFIAITGSLSDINNPLAILTTILSVVLLTVIPLLSKEYSLLFAVFLYIPQIVSLFAFPGVSTIYGADWLLPIAFLIPTLSLSIKSINDKQWYNRIGTVLLIALMLVFSSLSIAGTAYEILIVIDSFILIFYPIALYTISLWIIKKQSVIHATVEYPIDLTIITLGAIIANVFITTNPTNVVLIFILLLIGSVIGPLLYTVNRFIFKYEEISLKIHNFVSAGFILAIQILLITSGALSIVTTYFYIALMLSTTLVGLIIQYKEKFDSMTIIPSIISIMILPSVTAKYTPAISSWFTFSIFVVYIIILSLGWFGSRYSKVTFASYFVGYLAFILSLFVPSISFFIGLPSFFPMLLFMIWMIGVILSIIFTRKRTEGTAGFYMVWFFAITLAVIASNRIFQMSSSTADLLSFNLTTIPAIFVFILFSTYLQYKMKYSNKGMISHILAVQTLLIYVGAMMFSFMPFPATPQTAQMLTYIFYNVFTIIVFIVVESLVIEYTLVKTDTPQSEYVNIFLFLPVYVFSLIMSIHFNYYGIIPLILGVVFYGMSQRHNMNVSSVLGAIAVATSAFFITPPDQILTYTAFGIVSGIMTGMIVVGILLYLKTKNEFHIVTTVSIALIAEVIIGFISPMPLALQFGLTFNLAVIGVLIGVIFSIREFQIIFNVAWGILLIPYIAITFVKQEEAGLLALLFLVTGALLILASYLIYNRKKEKLQVVEEKTANKKKDTS